MISVLKPGYAMATSPVTYYYSHFWAPTERHVPDESHPVNLLMRKLQGAEPLARIDWHFKLPYTDQPIRIDLLEGKVVPVNGDLTVTLERPEGEVSSHTYQSWSVGLQAVDGGLIDAGAKYRTLFAAPAEGYQKALAWKFATNSPSNWTTVMAQGILLKSRNDRFRTKAAIILGINQYPGENISLDIEGSINTNGSGNWEATIGQ